MVCCLADAWRCLAAGLGPANRSKRLTDAVGTLVQQLRPGRYFPGGDTAINDHIDRDRRLLGLLDIHETWQTGLVFLLGLASLLGTTQLLRNQALVYFGSAQLVAGTLDLTWSGRLEQLDDNGWLDGSEHGRAGAWQSGLSAVTARRAGVSEFYTEPCFQITFMLTLGCLCACLLRAISGTRSLSVGHGRVGYEVL